MKKLNNAVFMLQYAAKYVPKFLFWTVIEGVVWGCIHSFTSVLFVKSLFDKIENNSPFLEILILIVLMAIFFILAYIFHEWYWKLLEPTARQELHEKMQEKLFSKAKELDLSCYDNPEFYNDFVWAINEADSRTIAICEDIGKIINRLLSSTVIIGVLFTVDIWIVAAVCISVGITVGLKLIRTKIQFKLDIELRPLNREVDYIGRVHYLADYAKELRMSDAEEIFIKKYNSLIDNTIAVIKKYGYKLFYISVAQSFSVSLLFDVLILLLLVYKIMIEKSISLGDFAATLGAMWKLFWQINNLMDYFVKFKEHNLYADKFRVFLNYNSTVCNCIDATECNRPLNTLELKNVSFFYPNTKNAIIKNLSMTIKSGQKIALVGYNGAGKSTLIKLLLRLYDVSSGEILFNGENVKNFTLNSYRNNFATVFQDFQIYAATIAENVLSGEYIEKNKKTVLTALSKSGFDHKLLSLPDDIFTPLTKEFDNDGTNLSGGEAQKIAIARVFAKPCDIIILDEPSSALDPISEYELNRTIMENSDKTVIIISHRLSTTRNADMIYMLENGEIIEQGNHEQLIRIDGKYAEMFNKQAEKYSLGRGNTDG